MLKRKLREYHVRCVRLDRHFINLREAGREMGCIVVIFSKTLNVEVERVEARSS